MLKRRTLAVIVALMGVSWSALPATAAEGTYVFDDFAIPNPTRPPTVRTLLTIDTSTIAGQTCQVIVDTINGESVHAENFITVEGGVPTITVTGTEDGAFGVKQNTTTVVMGDTLIVRNHFQRATSVEGDVIISCQDDTTTTTSTTAPESSTTTTAPAETTTTTGSSTTTSLTTSSTVPPVTSTTAPTGSTTTTSPPNTSTTSPDGSTSTSVPPTESTNPPPNTTPPTLPYTGPADVGRFILLGSALLALGVSILLGGRGGR